jgi:inward rectifier potassium channel
LAPPKPRRTRGDRTVKIGIRRRPLADLYHFLLTTSWTKLVLAIFSFYLVANGVFATLYWLDRGGVDGVSGFADAYFFSVQTMVTIGYGRMVPVSGFANALVTVEGLFGLLGFAMATGLMFAKFSRPTARVTWSKFIVVSPRDGIPSLMMRVANERATGLVEATLRLILLRDEKTAEGEYIRRFHPLELVRSQTSVFALSFTAAHHLKESSPLHGATPESLREVEAEIVASMVGTDEVTGDMVHARHIWTAEEVLFGKKYKDILTHRPDGTIVIDYREFHEVEDAS